jgi:hypothetical protein
MTDIKSEKVIVTNKSLLNKTEEEIKSLQITRGLLITVSKMTACKQRDYLDKMIYDNYYQAKFIDTGSLTDRIENINNKISYREITKRCFDGNDLLSNIIEMKLPYETETFSIIKELHDANPSLTGSFLEYLIRRLIYEIKGEKGYSSNKIEHECSDVTISYANKTIKELYKLCKEVGLKGYSSMNKETIIKVLEDLAKKNKCCRKLRDCEIPICAIMCMNKCHDIDNYKTKDIVREIFIQSIYHTMRFASPNQESFTRVYKIIDNSNNLESILIIPLIKICNIYIYK